MEPEVAVVGENGVREEDLLVHDARSRSRAQAYLLAGLRPPDFPTALGIFRQVEKPTYDDLLMATDRRCDRQEWARRTVAAVERRNDVARRIDDAWRPSTSDPISADRAGARRLIPEWPIPLGCLRPAAARPARIGPSPTPLPPPAESDELILLQNEAWFCSLRWLVIAALLGLSRCWAG